jgi:hypothetical protein
LKTGAYNVTVTPGDDTTLHGPAGFTLDPKESETVAATDPVSTLGRIEMIGIREATDGKERAGTIVLAAAPDEVSAEIAALFGSYGQQYQALSGQAAAFHDRFVSTLTMGSSAYQGAEAIAR